MKKLHISFTAFILFALVSIIFSCKQQTQNVDVEADIAAITETMKKWETLTNAGDLDRFMSLWAKDGVRMPTDVPPQLGVAKIRENMKPLFEKFIIDIKIGSVDEAKVFGDIGLTRCNNISLAITPKAGGEKIIVFQNAKSLTIHKKQLDGTWKVLYDCFNSNVAPIQD